jgi:hypothetical protein
MYYGFSDDDGLSAALCGGIKKGTEPVLNQFD